MTLLWQCSVCVMKIYIFKYNLTNYLKQPFKWHKSKEHCKI